MIPAKLAAIVVLALTTFDGYAQECSVENWKACHEKPWIIGNTLETPIGDKWWPNQRWGPQDEAGSTNWYTKPEVVGRGLVQAKAGKVYRLGRPYTGSMPMFSERKFVLRIPGNPSGGPFGANNLIYNEEFVAAEIGQVGTQFDGLGHVGVAVNGAGDKTGMRYYNGFTEAEIGASLGLKKLGVEKLHPVVARGILLDIAATRGVEAMETGQEITLADVNETLQHQGMAGFQFMPGDVVLFRTGWGQHWIKDNPKYSGGEPGIGMEVAKWLSDTVQAGVAGADTWGVEAVPNPDKLCAFCVHSHLITRHGILLQENLDLDQLARDKIWTFLYIYSVTPMVGATGSIGSPLAIR